MITYSQNAAAGSGDAMLHASPDDFRLCIVLLQRTWCVGHAATLPTPHAGVVP